MDRSQTKSKQRVADYGEVFTAEREVNAMLDLVKQETERIESRFLEPACGNGNFLSEILRRKLAAVKSRYGKHAADYERYAVIAVTSVYGVDILQDNVDDCRARMFAIFDASQKLRNFYCCKRLFHKMLQKEFLFRGRFGDRCWGVQRQTTPSKMGDYN